jgi:hypothetical protein
MNVFWTPNYLQDGAAIGPPGWYACRSSREGGEGYSMICTFEGPYYGGEQECRQMCLQRNAPIMEAVRAAIRSSGGERTTEGVVFNFVCGACLEKKTAREHVGGVWFTFRDGPRQHASICAGCSLLYDPRVDPSEVG